MTDTATQNGQDPVKPITFIVMEQQKSWTAESSRCAEIARYLEKQDPENIFRVKFDGNRFMDCFDNARWPELSGIAMRKCGQIDGPAKVVFLSHQSMDKLLEDDLRCLFEKISNGGEYPVKMATLEPVELGMLKRFENKYDMSVYGVAHGDMEVLSDRLLNGSFSQTSKILDAQTAAPRSLREIFSDAEKLQRSAKAALDKIGNARSAEKPAVKITPPRQPVLKRRR